MANGKIDVDVKVVRDVSKGLKEDVDDIEQLINEIAEIEDEIRAAWVSNYTESFVECIEETRQKMIRTKNSIGNISSSLDQTATSIERTENELRNIFGNSGGFSGSGGSHRF